MCGIVLLCIQQRHFQQQVLPKAYSLQPTAYSLIWPWYDYDMTMIWLWYDYDNYDDDYDDDDDDDDNDYDYDYDYDDVIPSSNLDGSFLHWYCSYNSENLF